MSFIASLEQRSKSQTKGCFVLRLLGKIVMLSFLVLFALGFLAWTVFTIVGGFAGWYWSM